MLNCGKIGKCYIIKRPTVNFFLQSEFTSSIR